MLKISSKVIYSTIGVVAGCALTIGLVTTNAANGSYPSESSEPSTSASEISSVASSEDPVSSLIESSSEPSSTPEPSSKTEIEAQTESAVSKIQKTTDDGVSKIEEATSKAVQEVKQAVSEASSAPVHKITSDKSKLISTDDTVWNVRCNTSMSFVDETNKIIVIGYFGHFAGDWEDAAQLKSKGFTIKNSSGSEINYEPYDSCRMKVPYENLSDVSELYFTYQDQSIKITVS